MKKEVKLHIRDTRKRGIKTHLHILKRLEIHPRYVFYCLKASHVY